MFTNEDYRDYFDQIARVERKMIYGAYDLGRDLNEPSLQRILQKIGDDEVRHYGYVLKMLRLAVPAGDSEKRRAVREYALGAILLRKRGDLNGGGLRSYCVNLSTTGICLECEEALFPDDVWSLEIKLFGQNESLFYEGKVIWCKKVEPELYISGIDFGRVS